MIHLESLKLAFVELPTYPGMETDTSSRLFHVILSSVILPILGDQALWSGRIIQATETRRNRIGIPNQAEPNAHDLYFEG